MIKQLDKIPSHSEWNKIAKENNLLNFISLQYITNQSFYDFCKSIRGT